MTSIARVEPLTTARGLRGPFDYRIPAEMDGVGVGSVLAVPFGRRRLLGVVVELAAESALPLERLSEPIEVLEPGLTADLVDLGRWIAGEYCSTPARGLALVLPPGTGTGASPTARTRMVLNAELTEAGLAALDPGSATRIGDGQRRALEALRGGPATATELAEAAASDHGALRRLAGRGLIALERRPLRRRIAGVALGEAGGGVARRSAHRRISGGRGRAREHGGSHGHPGAVRLQGPGPVPPLTRAQDAALAAVLQPLQAGRHETMLLHGVTASGKTEVYLRAAAAAIEQGRSAIVLVPEIALTPQAARRFRERFGDTVAVLHSQLGLGERYDEWGRLRSGEARVCVGPRSAVFAPLADVGLIVLDEEHDSAYKQESDPRYDARRVAERRAAQAGAVLLAGSATPRPESWLRMRRLTLPERVDGIHLPPVELIDMRGSRHVLHRRTREALDEVRRAGGKAIVLVNRRGWSPFIDCGSCGHAWSCPHCDVTLTLHRGTAGETGGGQALRCHHCGHAEPVPGVCPECHSTAVARHGTGTQRLEAELRASLAPMPIFRLDRDAATRKNGLATVLRDFEQATSGVLVGTQMVAQGHDFPEVSLAVVQDADATLRFPDFRAEERTFSLVAQLAGRSGRSALGGRVLVQTACPEASCLQAAARHDAESFLVPELERRRALGYPPFSELVRVVTAAREPELAERAAVSVREGIGGAGRVLGPAPLFRLKDRHRSVLLVKTRELAPTVAAVGEAVERAAADSAHRGVAFGVDVDPQ